MPILPFRLENGVRAAASADADTAEFCTDAVNFYSQPEGLEKRFGNAPLWCRRGSKLQELAWSEESEAGGATNLPGTFSASETCPTIAAGKYAALWLHFPYGPTCKAFFTATTTASAQVPFLRPMFFWFDAGTLELKPLAVFDQTQPAYNYATGAYTVGTGFSVVGSATQTVELSFVPPKEWASTVVDFYVVMMWSEAQYPEGMVASNPYTSPINAGSPALSYDTDLPLSPRVVCVYAWKDQAGTPHRFVALTVRNTVGSNACTMEFYIDDVLLAEVGNITDPGGIPEDQKVEAFYHPPTDRLLGHLPLGNWFFAIPGDNTINLLEAFYESGTDAAVANPFASDPGGLRPTMPLATTATVHDGRVFALVGESLQWSAPDAYPDTWPNANEAFLLDNGGPGTDLCSLGAALLVAKRDCMYLVQPSGAPQGYDAAIISSGTGAIGKITPCGSFALITADDGLYVFDGSTMTCVSDQLSASFFAGALGSLGLSLGVFFAPLGQWRLFYPTTDSSICDRALYVDLAGWTPDTTGMKKSSMGCWPQGAYSTTDDADSEPGLLVTAVCVDSTGDRKRVLIGTALGDVMEMDVGTWDGTAPVKARAVQAPVNIGGQTGLMVNRIKAVFETDVARDITFGIIPNGWADKERTATVNINREAGYSANGAFPATFSEWDAAGFTTFLTPFTRFPDFATRLQTFQSVIRDESEGGLRVLSVGVDVSPGSGRR